MALKVWSGGAGDGAWATAGNWVGGVAPVSATDSVLFTGTSSLTSGHTALNASTFLGIETDENYTGSIGSSGSPLRCGISTNAVRHRGSGQFHFKVGDAFSGPGIFIDPKVNTATCSVDATTVTITVLAISRGSVTITGTGTFTDIFIQPRFNALNEVVATVSSGLTTITRMKIFGGTTTISQTVTDLFVYGGDVTIDSEATTTLHQSGGYVKQNYAPGTGTVGITTVWGHAGILDLMQSTGGKKITTLYEGTDYDFRWLKDGNIHIVTNLIPFNYVAPGR